MARIAAFLLAWGATGASVPIKPHVIFILTDDLGWNTAWNNLDIHSPTLNTMAAEGLKLTSQYVYRYCSPTRAAFLVGRSPYKLLNIRDNLPDEQVTDERFTMLPRRLHEAGYYSYQIGKWHQGMKSHAVTPVGRGFQESYGFLGGAENHYTSKNGPKCEGFGQPVDYFAQGGEFSEEGAPITSCEVPKESRVACPLFKVISSNESMAHAANLCRRGVFANCAFDGAEDAEVPCYQCFVPRYTGYDLTDRAVHVIKKHASERFQTPMFMYLALQNTHSPIQAPDEYVALYNFSLEKRNIFNAMVSVVDRSVAQVTQALRSTGMWNNTLLIWTTDNGSPTQVAGSNAPLRGGKGSSWEGGTRVPAFVSGGLLPPRMAGRTLDGIIAIWDYFATFCGLAGVDPKEPQSASPTPVDSYDMWPYLSGQVDMSPRSELVLDHLMFERNTTACIYHGYIQAAPCMGAGAIRVGDYKILVGTHGHAGHYGHFSPNTSWSPDMSGLTLCSMKRPCLFNVTADMAEEHDLADELPEVVAGMLKRYHAYDEEYHPPTAAPPSEDDLECAEALHSGGFRTPWRTGEASEEAQSIWV